MKKFLSLLIVVIAITGLSSCESYTIQYPEEDVYVSFSESIQPIFNSECTGCHPSVNPLDLSAGNSYAALTSGGFIDTNDPENSLLYLKLKGTHSTYTSKRNKDFILAWIQAGAPND